MDLGMNESLEANSEFVEFMSALGLRFFSPSEFLVMGGGNQSGSCAGKNGTPPKALWPNIVATARLLDRLRAELGYSIRITSAYRNKPYNTCIGGEPGSFHMKFNATDFQADGGSPRAWANKLLELRQQGVFTGGVGLYPTFVHVDTRGYNATWGF